MWLPCMWSDFELECNVNYSILLQVTPENMQCGSPFAFTVHLAIHDSLYHKLSIMCSSVRRPPPIQNTATCLKHNASPLQALIKYFIQYLHDKYTKILNNHTQKVHILYSQYS